MKKQTRKNGISALALGAMLAISAGSMHALSAKATAQSAHEDLLFAPTSYEQYLPLTSPTDVAVSTRYTAIADGNQIYLYDNQETVYKVFTHTQNGRPNDDVKQLQFCENGNLYYADNSTGANFYELDLETLVSTNDELTDIACSTFTIDGTTLYFANSSGALYSASLTDYGESMPALPFTAPNKPTLAFWNEELYFTDNASMQYLNKYNPKTQQLTSITALDENKIERMTITQGVLAYVSTSNAFFAYTLPRLQSETLRFTSAGAFTAVACIDSNIYAVHGKEIRHFDIQTNAFTSFAICGDSALPHRLNGAKDVCVQGKQLFVADTNNSRISVFNENGQIQNNFALDFAPEYIACGEREIFVADKTQVALYSFTGEKQASLNGFVGDITGIASVFDKHYLVTADNYYYQIYINETGAITTNETQKTAHIPKMLTADIYGNLYIAGNGQNATYAYRFTESEFINPDENGTQVLDSLPLGVQKIAVDFDGNIYALAENKIYKNGNEQGSAQDFSAPLVYGDSVQTSSFAFGQEENKAFVLANGNYLLQTQRLQLPSLKQISTNGIDSEIFSEQSTEFIVVDVQKNALLVQFDLHQLQGASHFPYAGYTRTQTPLKALRLGTSGNYCVIAVYDDVTCTYQTYYTRSAFTQPAKDYFTPFESVKTGYITSDVTLYKFPYLTNLLTAGSLQRGAKVEILGELSLDHEYYQIRYQTDDGERTGYIPKSFVAETDGLAPQAQTVVLGKDISNTDALFALAYVLLGLLAIAVLVNYLILRKTNKK